MIIAACFTMEASVVRPIYVVKAASLAIQCPRCYDAASWMRRVPAFIHYHQDVFPMNILRRFGDSTAPYAFLIRNAFLTALSFRLRTILFFLSSAMGILVQIFLWRALFSMGVGGGGVTLHDTISYLILQSMLDPLFHMRAGQRLASGIFDGSIATDLLKPLSLKLTYAAHESGATLADLLLRALPPALLWAVVFRVPGPASPAALGAAVMTLILGLLLNYQVEMIIGQTAFWLQDTWYLKWFHSALSMIFAGTFVPLWFYPGALRAVSEALPFRFTAFVPLSIYLGRTSVDSLPSLVLSATIWIVILGALERLIWARGIRRVIVLGG
jgi:ABC-2 type transport system permease protein